MEPKSVRLVVIAIAMCVLFALVIGNAFKFLPEDANNITPISVEDLNSARSENNDEYKDEASENNNEEDVNVLQEKIRRLEVELEQSKNKNGNEDFTNNVEKEKKPFEELSEDEKNTEISSDFNKNLQDGHSKFKAGDYQSALLSYEEALNSANSSEEKSLAYVGISKSYALQRRYGSAISNAQKANNAYSTYETKVLLAKLNYRTGNVAQAEQAMKALLESGF